MPYVSEDQRKYFNANRAALEAKGINVQEWNEASKGKELPERKQRTEKHKMFKNHPFMGKK